ncbi:MAG: hypothetical protein SOW20_03065 [Berryella intestinalis]|uniref:hypothetical protein n=1 Tax=Berryella intestinalis TaxID=1531429 RepID=UPI002A4E9F7C|nr:hypothetical protein [Berryella intestinalis]MDD7369541.1 hypothetical protein [Berryella intestinalis]MDY3128992.1 hypothetical protein [Berryella intestinalis]
MAQLLDNVQYLSQEVGPRPAGTEEEQQAALYIADQMQKESGFAAVIDDFSTSIESSFVRGVCAALIIVATILGIALPALSVGVLIVTIIAAVVFALESLDRPYLSSQLGKGASQNVVAKYAPDQQEGLPRRSRKIILVAHYDSGRVRPAYLRFVENIPAPMPQICSGAVVAVPVLTLLRQLIASQGPAALFFNLLLIVALIGCAVLVARTVIARMAPFSEGANDNASGVAALLEVARRVGGGSNGSDARIQGYDAAREQGLIDDETEVVYEAPVSDSAQVAGTADEPPRRPAPSASVSAGASDDSPLSAAKAALAAFTGAPGAVWTPRDERAASGAPSPESSAETAPTVTTDKGASPVGPSVSEVASADGEAAVVAAEPPVVSAELATDPSVPDWFVAAQQKARRSDSEVDGSLRSRYADAGEEALAQREAQAVLDSSAAADGAVAEEAALEARSTESAWHTIEADEVTGDELGSYAQPAESAVMAQEEQPSSFEDARSASDSAEALDALYLSGGGAAPEGGNAVVEDVPAEVISTESYFSPKLLGEDAPVDREALSAEFASLIEQKKASEPILPSGENLTEGAFESSVPEPGFMRNWPEGSAELTGRIDVTDLDIPASESLVDAKPVITPVAPAIELPQVAAPAADAVEPSKQPAPLADQPPASAVARGLDRVPAIDPAAIAAEHPSKSGVIRGMRTVLPSVSGTITRVNAEEASPVSTVGSFVAGATGSITPVGEELLEGASPEEIYVDDADDSGIEENFTDSGAPAGPGYVEMPKSRFQRFMDRLGFSNKKEDLKETPQEWLDVEQDFDARETGRARGGWESFRNESEGYDSKPRARKADADDPSVPAAKKPTQVSNGVASAPEAYTEDGGYLLVDDSALEPDAPYSEIEPNRSWNTRKWNGGAFSRVQLGRVDTKSRIEDAAEDEPVKEPVSAPLPEVAAELNEEISQIYHFNNPDFTTEIWFVALGSEIGRRDGMRAFLDKYASELRGSIVIDIDSIAAGKLALVQEEGTIRKVKPSSRMKRYIQKASRVTGKKIDSVSLPWNESSITVASRRGLQGMHLVGVEAEEVALSATSEDVIENVSEDVLSENTDFIVELVKSI